MFTLLKKYKLPDISKNNFITIFPRLENFHLSKDVGQIPYHLHKEFDMNSFVITYKNSNNYDLSSVKGLKLFFLPKLNFFKISLSVIIFLIVNSKQIKILNLFHIRIYNLIYIYIYKFINKDGIVYIKGDLSAKDLEQYGLLEKSNIKKYIGRFLLKRLAKYVDVLSAETTAAVKILKKDYSCIFRKIILIPNGVDKIFVEENCIRKLSFDDKENLIITVARIGEIEKNNEMMLNVIEKIDLKNWKFFFIGPIAVNFQLKIDDFLLRNPEKNNSVKFIGNVDKKELYEFYNKAKVFCLTSLYEGFPLVFPEALYFGNYIISTDVSSAEDVISNNNGAIINNTHDFEILLNKIINDNYLKSNHIENSYKLSNNKFLWQIIIKKLYKELKIENKK